MNPKLLTAAKTVLPASLKSAIRNATWQALRLDWQLHSGLLAQIDTASDWYIFNEIFVDADYDEAIERVLGDPATGRRLKILDLGANVGFFSLRVIHKARDEFDNIPLHITAVEGNPRTFEMLKARITANDLSNSVEPVHGLVGPRAGIGTITDMDFSGNNTLQAEGRTELVEVPYVDLLAILGNGEIDLLKCDIEGSELLFAENYSDLLANVRVAVFELHPTVCDTEQCLRLLRDAGLAHSKVVMQKDSVQLVQMWRD
jgi:FkbM family methyltransferase